LDPTLPDILTHEEDDPDEDPDYAVTSEKEEAGALEEITPREYLRACRDAWRRRSQGGEIWRDAALIGVKEVMEAKASPIASVSQKKQASAGVREQLESRRLHAETMRRRGNIGRSSRMPGLDDDADDLTRILL
jgi:hypothetical protein